MATATHRSTIATSQAAMDRLLAEVLPRQGQWDAEGYLWLTDHTNRLIEFTDGYIEVLPMPTDEHQTILLFLYDLFRVYLAPLGGKVLVAPLRVRIRERKYREPDILLVQDANDPRRQNRYWLGADLVMEIISPDDPERDTKAKRVDYAEAGISEYWIVNPEDETITVLQLESERYVEHGIFRRGDVVSSALLMGLTVDVNAVFDAR